MNNGISNMGGNMQGTPISQLLNNNQNNNQTMYNATPSPPATNPIYIPSKPTSIKQIVNKINKQSQKEKSKKKYKIEETDDDDDDKDNTKDKDDKEEDIEEDIEEDDDNNNKKDKKDKDLQIPEIIKDAGLIWIIYLVLSVNIIKEFIGNYIKYINPNTEGVVEFKGVIVYGLLLSILFLVSKLSLKYFNKY